MKPGWQTTEFWAMAGANVIALFVLTGVIGPDQQTAVQEQWTQFSAAIVQAVTIAAYAIGRALVKRGQ